MIATTLDPYSGCRVDAPVGIVRVMKALGLSAQPRRGVTATAVVALLVSGTFACKSHRDKKKVEEKSATVVDTGPQPGGHLRLPSNEPVYLNPVIQQQSELASPLIFEGLVGLDARLEPVERLATKWNISADGKTLTFQLRKGVKWHDGTPFSSKDVQFTFQAIRETEVRSLWKAYMDPVAEIATPDAHTVVVTYKQPFAPALKAWTVGILPKHVYEKGPLSESPHNREPVGTGPYKLHRWEPGKRLILQANDSWWYGRPNINSIELLVNIDSDKLVEALNQGKIDFASIDDIGQWREHLQSPEFRESFEVQDVVEAHFRVFAWNTRRQILSDNRVRQALTSALNRGAVVDDVLLGQGQLLSGPFFPNMFGANPAIALHPFDLKRAGAMLDEAGHPLKEGSRFPLEVIALEGQDNPVTHATIGLFRRDLNTLGVNLEVKHLSPSKFFEAIKAGDFDAAYYGWLPEIADPDPYGLLHSSMADLGSNYAGYQNPEADTLLEQARSETDRTKRKNLYHNLHKILRDDVPYTVLYAPYGHYAWSKRVRAVNPHDIGAQPRFPGIARWWLSKDPPGARQSASTPGR